MKKLIDIKTFDNNLLLTYINEDNIKGLDDLQFSGTQQQFTKKEWINTDEIISYYDEESQNKILNALELTTTEDFFINKNIEQKHELLEFEKTINNASLEELYNYKKQIENEIRLSRICIKQELQ